MPGGCVCRVGVACCVAGSKHADAGRSQPFALWCPSPAVPSRAGCWHGPWMWFGRRLAVVRFLFCNPWHWGWAGSSRRSRTLGSLGCSWVLGYPGWAPSSSLSHVPTPLALQPVLTSQREFRLGVQGPNSLFPAPFPAAGSSRPSWERRGLSGVLGIRMGFRVVSLGQAPSCPGNRD